MKKIEKYEEKYISAYCRLSYEVWYQGYKDDVSRYLNKNTLDKAIGMAAEDKTDNKVIRIDGVACQSLFGMKECIEAVLHFLYLNDEYSLVYALPFEDQKEADRLAYEQTNRLIDIMKFSGEMHEQDFQIMIWSISRKSERYLKVFKSAVNYAIYDRENKCIKRGHIEIDDALFNGIIEWVKRYISDNKMTEIFEGMSCIRSERFQVCFALDKLGIANDSNCIIPEYCFEKVEGNGILSKLLQLPELEEFIRKEM